MGEMETEGVEGAELAADRRTVTTELLARRRFRWS